MAAIHQVTAALVLVVALAVHRGDHGIEDFLGTFAAGFAPGSRAMAERVRAAHLRMADSCARQRDR